uniref:Uncharacterized protein n=1 Tax=Arundo donax TaxID=35708 RepID=A0A0A8YGA5_ARUDO
METVRIKHTSGCGFLKAKAFRHPTFVMLTLALKNLATRSITSFVSMVTGTSQVRSELPRIQGGLGP